MTRSHLPPCHRVHEVQRKGAEGALHAQVSGFQPSIRAASCGVALSSAPLCSARRRSCPCADLASGWPVPQQQQSAPPRTEQVLTLSVPGGLERHLTSSHIKRLTWDDYICLYEVSDPPPLSPKQFQGNARRVVRVLPDRCGWTQWAVRSWARDDFSCIQCLLDSTHTLRWGDLAQSWIPGWAQNYLEEMASMLLQAEGDGSSAAGTRLQRLSTELVAPACWPVPPPHRRSCPAPAYVTDRCCCLRLAHTLRAWHSMPGKEGPGSSGPGKRCRWFRRPAPARRLLCSP